MFVSVLDGGDFFFLILCFLILLGFVILVLCWALEVFLTVCSFGQTAGSC